MEGEQTRVDSPVDNVPTAELTAEQKEYLQKAKAAGWTETTAYDYEEPKRAEHDDTAWFGAAKIYSVEWQDEFGDVGPEIPELEQALFHSEHQQRKGEHLDALNFEVAIDGPSNDRLKQVSSCLLTTYVPSAANS